MKGVLRERVENA